MAHPALIPLALFWPMLALYVATGMGLIAGVCIVLIVAGRFMS